MVSEPATVERDRRGTRTLALCLRRPSIPALTKRAVVALLAIQPVASNSVALGHGSSPTTHASCARSGDERLAWANLHLRAVLRADGHVAGDHIADVFFRLVTRRWLNVPGPAPTRSGDAAPNRGLSELHRNARRSLLSLKAHAASGESRLFAFTVGSSIRPRTLLLLAANPCPGSRWAPSGGISGEQLRGQSCLASRPFGHRIQSVHCGTAASRRPRGG